MDTIIFVETTKSGSSREAIKAAEQLGYFTVLITERKSFVDQRKEFENVHQMIFIEQITEKNMRNEIKKLQEQGKIIITIISFIDPFVSLAARLSNELCNSEISVDPIEVMEDKTKTRKTLKNNPTAPKYSIYKPSDQLKSFIKDYNKPFPVVVKSPVSKASKDVYLVDNKQEMENTMKKFLKLYPSQKILIEEYLMGPQYLVEVLVHNGEIHIVAIIKQEITMKTRFIVTGYELQLSHDEQLHQTLIEAVTSVIKDLKVNNSACHLEIRHVNGEWKLIEINPRISGGAMNRMIEEAYGINLVEETIKLYLGFIPKVKRKWEKHIYTHYITIGSYGNLLKVTGRNKAVGEPGVVDVYIKPRKGAQMTPPISMGHRYGYVMATGNTCEEAKLNAINAAQHIKFYLEPI